MSSKVVQDLRLYLFLARVDKDIAEGTRKAKCPFCGGVLH